MTEFTGQVVGFDYLETDVALLLQHEEEFSTYEIAKNQFNVLFNCEDDSLEKVLRKGCRLSVPFKLRMDQLNILNWNELNISWNELNNEEGIDH